MDLVASAVKLIVAAVLDVFPGLEMVATTLRNAKTAGLNDWGAILHAEGVFHVSRIRPGLEIYDRVGGGDGFASGMIWALLEGRSPAEAVEIGAAHGALTMTTPGDTSMVTSSEVMRAVDAQGARVVR
jgi:2-dehydro-3-deoxygluconokinase